MAAIEVDQGELRAAALAVGRAVAAVDCALPAGGTGIDRVDAALSGFAARWNATARAWVSSVQALAGALSDAADTYDAVDTSAVPELSR